MLADGSPQGSGTDAVNDLQLVMPGGDRTVQRVIEPLERFVHPQAAEIAGPKVDGVAA